MNIVTVPSPAKGLAVLEMDRVISRRDAAEWLGVTVATMDRWQREGTGPVWVRFSYRTGGYTVGALADFVRSRAVRSRTQCAA